MSTYLKPITVRIIWAASPFYFPPPKKTSESLLQGNAIKTSLIFS